MRKLKLLFALFCGSPAAPQLTTVSATTTGRDPQGIPYSFRSFGDEGEGDFAGREYSEHLPIERRRSRYGRRRDDNGGVWARHIDITKLVLIIGQLIAFAIAYGQMQEQVKGLHESIQQIQMDVRELRLFNVRHAEGSK